MNDDDPEAVAYTGKQFRVARTRTTQGGTVLVMVGDATLTDPLATRIFRECDLMKVKGD